MITNEGRRKAGNTYSVNKMSGSALTKDIDCDGPADWVIDELSTEVSQFLVSSPASCLL